MPTLLDDQTAIDYDDPVSAQHRTQPVRDDQGGARAQQIFHRLLHKPLTLAVQTRCRLVENHQRRILEEHSGDRDALTLTA